MEQRSDEWFKARVGVITGSRVGGILGVNPFQKAEDVMRDMVREHFGADKEFTGNAATNHGERMEPVALAHYESVAGVTVTQTGIVKHDDYEWLGASPDGLIGLDGGLEIKCPYWAKKPYSVHEKPSYYAQCQHVMEVCDLQWMDFFCYIREDLYLLERLERNPTWFADNFPKLEAFHKKYLETIADESKAKVYLDTELAVVSNVRSELMSDLFLQIKEKEAEIAPLKEAYEALKKELGSEFGSFRTGRIEVLKVEKKGAVDHAAIYKAVDVDSLLAAKGKSVEAFRKDPVISYIVKSAKD
jgi:putative phage-type endonuclease